MMGRGIVQKKGIQSLVRDEIVHIHAIYQDKVRVNENQIQFVYHQGELLYEKGGEESSYHLGGGTEAVWRLEETHYYHQDEQLSTAFITNEKREIQNHYQYDAFGNEICQEEGISNRIRYTGQQYDGVTGQYYLRARYYNPIVGRFLQEDEYQGDGLNLYAYCGNNSVRYYDPSGYSKTPEVYNTGCPGATTNGGIDDTKTDPRNEMGTVIGGEALYDVEKMMRGSQGNIGIIPKEIGDKLRGQTFKTFDDFREAFWIEIGNSQYADEFSKQNRTLMKQGKAPYAVPEQWNGGNVKSIIHHKKPIYIGGGVYDLNNIVIVTPKMHMDILDRNYHFNNYKDKE